MRALEVRIVSRSERLERLRRLAAIKDIEALKPPPPPVITNDQFEIAHEIIFRGGFTKVETIQRAVLVEFPGITLADLKSNRRLAAVVRPRQIAMFICKDMTNKSLPDIGRRFGGRDHTTVIHAIKKIGNLIEEDAEMVGLIRRVKARIEVAEAAT